MPARREQAVRATPAAASAMYEVRVGRERANVRSSWVRLTALAKIQQSPIRIIWMRSERWLVRHRGISVLESAGRPPVWRRTPESVSEVTTRQFAG